MFPCHAIVDLSDYVSLLQLIIVIFHCVDWKSIERQASQERIEVETKRNSVSEIIIFIIIFQNRSWIYNDFCNRMLLCSDEYMIFLWQWSLL